MKIRHMDTTFQDFSQDPFPLNTTAIHRTRSFGSACMPCGLWRALNGLAKFRKETVLSSLLPSSPSLILFRNGFEKRAAGVPSKRGRKRVYRHEKNEVSTSISQWEHFLSRRGPQGRSKDGPGPCTTND